MNRLFAAAATAALLALIGCSSSTAPGPRLSLAFSAQAPTATTATDALVITKAEIVVRKIELKQAEGDDCEFEGVGQGEGENPGPQETCEEFEAGPARVSIPLDGTLVQVSITPPAGTYRVAEFKIHKVGEDGAAEAAFAAANPDIAGKSIRVEGTFNGKAFVFESDLSAKQETELVPPLVVTATTATNVTITVKLSDWFKGAGGALIDPATANKGGANEMLVKENIKRSFRAFEDKDVDGHEDH
jgi:hypothetical protein